MTTVLLNRDYSQATIRDMQALHKSPLAIDKDGNRKIYSGIDVYLHPMQCKRGANFLKNISKSNQSASTDSQVAMLKNRLNDLSARLKSGVGYIPGRELSTSRFPDISTASATQVKAPDGKALAANRVCVNGKNIAIASQYPKEGDLSSYFKMLVENRTPALVVLASEKEVTGTPNKISPTNPDYMIPGSPGLPAYFRKSGNHDGVEVTVNKCKPVRLGKLKIEQHTLTVNVPGDKAISIPVIHVTDWPDREALSAADTLKLVEHVNKITDKKIEFYKAAGSKTVNDKNKLLPVIHCRAGVGRTGQLIAATALMNPASKASLESVVTDMRTSRNPLMVQTEKQMDQLIIMANELNKPLMTSAPARPTGSKPLLTATPPSRPTAPKPQQRQYA